MTDQGKNVKLTPEQQKERETYMQWTKRQYDEQYEKWIPWIEDQFLRFFTKDNKASYATKDTLNKTKVTGVEQVDNLQDGVNNTVSSQLGQGGIAQPISDVVSKEGINRAERKGKDDRGHMAPGPLGQAIDPNADQTKKGSSSLSGGAQKAGGYLSGMWSRREEK